MICFVLAPLVISAVSGQHAYDRTDYVNEEPLLFDTFPEGFQWGAATSAHQVSMTVVWGTDAIDEGCTLCTFTRSKGPTMWMESR